ncbi:MAG: SusD family protein [Bacteroidetes bacterium]|nr:SusD family protein [Bacteroidota bacterium]
MKKYILFIGVILLSFTSCDDFLEVKSESKYGEDFVFSSKTEINRALTSVYTSLLSGNTYGNSYLSTYALNNDVEFSSFSSSLRSVNGEDFKCFDGTRHASSIANTWASAYQGIERANIVINGIQNSAIFSEDDEDLMQMLSEARVLRAMFFHDLVVLFGDLPFTLEPSYNLESLTLPMTDRNEILSQLINDLKGTSKYMKYATELPEGIERVSREFCYAMIARMALTRGGYSLYPDLSNPLNVGTMKRQDDYLDYYEIAKNYADSVIESGKHSLTKSFRDVFIDECNYIVNNGDDPIFEIPFLKSSSGNVGYVHGPSGSAVDGLTTAPNVWGASNGGVRLNAFYRYSFDRKDLRLNYTVGMWYYDALGVPQIRIDYSTHANKWSKFWASSGNSLGVSSSGNTGINYPYMRYADVLLMYAEAVNELENGVTGTNGTKAIDALRQVRNRAFESADRAEKVEQYLTTASSSKEDFFKAIMNERKWEFGGENMRWKDLVRWNLYSKVVYDCFKEYFIVGNYVKGNFLTGYEKYENIPVNMYYKRIDNPANTSIYPNTTLQILDIYNLYENAFNPGATYTAASFYDWKGSDESEFPAVQCLYSFRGYVREGDDANYESLDPNNLPPVRYILPIPNKVIQMSNGTYKNYYGYN